MKGFKSLIRPFTATKGPTWDADVARTYEHAQFVRDIFPGMVEEAGFQYWWPEHSIPQIGRRILLGIAPWSIYDLTFLDELIRAMRIGHTADALIDVFNTDEADSVESLLLYYPALPQSPVWPFAGLWVDGIFQSLIEGHPAKDFIRSEFDMPPPPPSNREKWCDYDPI